MQHDRQNMIHKFVPERLQVPETKIELTRQRGHYTTIIKDPPPNPKDRVREEYDDEDNLNS